MRFNDEATVMLSGEFMKLECSASVSCSNRLMVNIKRDSVHFRLYRWHSALLGHSVQKDGADSDSG